MGNITGRKVPRAATYPERGPAAPPSTQTVAVVTSGNSPYAVKNSDIVVEFDESNGLLATADLPTTNLTIGEEHTFVYWGFTNSSPPPVVSGNGNPVVPYALGIQTSKTTAASTNITSQGGLYTVRWDGTQWMLVSVA